MTRSAPGHHDPRSRRTRVAAEQSWLRRRARRVLGRQLRRGLDSVDLSQQAQLEALKARDDVELETRGALRGWLGRIVDNLARQAGRKRSPEAATTSALGRVHGDTSTASCRAEREEQGEHLHAGLQALSERTRRVVELKYWDGLSHQEISERLGISPGNARVILNRGIAQLRGGLDDSGGAA